MRQDRNQKGFVKKRFVDSEYGTETRPAIEARTRGVGGEEVHSYVATPLFLCYISGGDRINDAYLSFYLITSPGGDPEGVSLADRDQH